MDYEKDETDGKNYWNIFFFCSIVYIVTDS